MVTREKDARGAITGTLSTRYRYALFDHSTLDNALSRTEYFISNDRVPGPKLRSKSVPYPAKILRDAAKYFQVSLELLTTGGPRRGAPGSRGPRSNEVAGPAEALFGSSGRYRAPSRSRVFSPLLHNPQPTHARVIVAKIRRRAISLACTRNIGLREKMRRIFSVYNNEANAPLSSTLPPAVRARARYTPAGYSSK
ncbi:hypothetical protein PUN28_008592 [Cardiocondyla obscurior]|uniref:Uncharacterized protein n=1 Tax=Cardiocondyla obscurior TaxID=286306 RepID=A0AAW2G1P4_9HYME